MKAEKMIGHQVGEFRGMPVRPYPGGIWIYRLKGPGDRTGVLLVEESKISEACLRMPSIYRAWIVRAEDDYGILKLWIRGKKQEGKNVGA